MKALRSALRRRRAELTATQIAADSKQISHHLWHLPAMARCQRIACYMAVGGEVDCAPVMDEALARGRRIYLPVLHGPALLFAPWSPGGVMTANRFGIAEPALAPGSCLRAAQLDVVLAPLVAFDDMGHRLGMGGGYYDRSLAFSRHRQLWRRPHIIGLAYEFQRLRALPAQRWDVALHTVITECGARFF